MNNLKYLLLIINQLLTAAQEDTTPPTITMEHYMQARKLEAARALRLSARQVQV